jgi:hypothetical protein
MPEISVKRLAQILLKWLTEHIWHLIATSVVFPFLIAKWSAIVHFMTLRVTIPVWLIFVIFIGIIFAFLVFCFVKKRYRDRESPLVFNEEKRLYYLQGDTEHAAPFCPHCYEAERRRIHLTEKNACPHCGKDFTPLLSFDKLRALL